MASLIMNPEGQLMPMNTIQSGWHEGDVYCKAGHRYDGVNYPNPSGQCTRCLYESAGMQMPSSGLPIPDGDPVAVLAARAAIAAQPVPTGVSPLYG